MNRVRLVAAVALSLTAACNNAPSTKSVASELRAQFGDWVTVKDVRRVNGVDHPAGNGSSQRYEVEYQATLVPKGPVTFQVAGGLDRAVEKGALIKKILSGLKPDPEGIEAFFDVGSALWRTDASKPATVSGTIMFLRTEKGWRSEEVRAYLADSLLAAGGIKTGARPTARSHYAPENGVHEPGFSEQDKMAARVSLIRTLEDLHNAEEVYYSTPGNYRYTANLSELHDLKIPDRIDISVEIYDTRSNDQGNRFGWSARGVHRGFPGTICAISVAAGPDPEPPALKKGVVGCTE